MATYFLTHGEAREHGAGVHAGWYYDRESNQSFGPFATREDADAHRAAVGSGYATASAYDVARDAALILAAVFRDYVSEHGRDDLADAILDHAAEYGWQAKAILAREAASILRGMR